VGTELSQTVRPDPALNAPGKRQAVRAMFAEIAPTYDRLNHLLSLNIDKRWRRFAVRQLEEVVARPGAVALDLCCGTADLTLELARRAHVVGCDFCHPMLAIGVGKVESEQPSRAALVEGDALRLPFADASFDAVTVAFGLRNLESVEGGLAEMLRVLKPGGRAAVLECSRPVVPLVREAYEFYFHRVLPRVGALVSGSRGAYSYLPASVRNFPDQKRLAGLMNEAGFINVKYHNLSAGVAALHLGDKLE
jgi:demethylmenaquinone methyltransferase / 2-methoxy-6-polyprenyl-1,4-benzoquinol methylase